MKRYIRIKLLKKLYKIYMKEIGRCLDAGDFADGDHIRYLKDNFAYPLRDMIKLEAEEILKDELKV